MRRFFSADSFWNQPIGREAAVDPASDRWLAMLAREPGGPFWINLREFTIPVYEVDDRTPRRTVHQEGWDPRRGTGRWGPRAKYWSHGPGFGRDVPIPDHAIPDPAGDAHMALVDWARGRVWDMWSCRKRADGEWESKTGMVYDAYGSGVWNTSDFGVKDGESIHFHGPGRAAGVPIVAGLALHAEVCSGRIAHKLAMATWHNAFKAFTSPATWTDGFCDGGLPEGAVMQLDPDLDPRAYDLSPAATTLVRAMQTYGMVNVDNAGGNVVYVEGLYGQPGKSWEGVLAPDELKRIPLERYRVLKLGPVTSMGDSREPGRR